MDALWKALDSCHCQVSAEKSKNNTDKQYAKNLAIKQMDENWGTFYQAIQALEMGPGFPDDEKLIALCQRGSEQDDRRLLSMIEKKSDLFDIVILLRCVSHEKKIEWLNSKAFSNAPTLFECLRQEIQYGKLTETQQLSIACGLCQLLKYSTARFQYLLNRFVIHFQKNIPIMVKLLPQLPESGWTALAACISFAELTPDHMSFWDQCGRKQDWSSLYQNAIPLLNEWNTYVEQSISTGKWGQSLYNNISNVLINILVYQLDSFPAYMKTLGNAISATEKAMLCWYERSTHQRGALFGCLAQIELLHYVWINNQEDYTVPFPEDLRTRLLQIILQYRFFWDEPMLKDTIQTEVLRLKEWLEQV